VTPGQRIKAAREALGLTQAEAAEAYGCTQPRWAEIEAQRFDPQVATLSRAAKVVGLALNELFTDASE
jgi:transcriptional regulator with XRE-family HTH domain